MRRPGCPLQLPACRWEYPGLPSNHHQTPIQSSLPAFSSHFQRAALLPPEKPPHVSSKCFATFLVCVCGTISPHRNQIWGGVCPFLQRDCHRRIKSNDRPRYYQLRFVMLDQLPAKDLVSHLSPHLSSTSAAPNLLVPGSRTFPTPVGHNHKPSWYLDQVPLSSFSFLPSLPSFLTELCQRQAQILGGMCD